MIEGPIIEHLPERVGSPKIKWALYPRGLTRALAASQADGGCAQDAKPVFGAFIFALLRDLRAFDPEYLRDCMQATESVIEKLQEHTTRPLFACKLRAKPELKVVAGGRG